MSRAWHSPSQLCAGGPPDQTSYKVLPAIVRNNLELFPVIAGRSFDTSQLLTLDEGIRSGQVTISENGDQPGLVHPGQSIPPRQRGAEVNRLVLYNNSAKPLLLLAGEIVTGGQQDRVIGSDRIVPPNTGPIDLSVFCVEPGRWTGAKPSFGSMSMQMAQPDVRAPAMAEQNQSMVWDNVRSSNAKAAAQLHGSESAALAGTSSYAKVFASPPVQKMIAGYGGAEGEQETLKELRSKGAVGVVVAINGPRTLGRRICQHRPARKVLAQTDEQLRRRGRHGGELRCGTQSPGGRRMDEPHGWKPWRGGGD